MPSLDLTGRHPGTVAIMRWFESDHLPPRLKAVAGRAAALAELMAYLLPDDPELVAGLRHLLAAKDCFVRAELSRTGDRVIPPDAPAIREMDGGEALAYLGVDASRWTDEFLFRWQTDAGTALDPGTLLSWFANAIQAGYDAARARYDRHPEPDAAAELIGQAVGHASTCWTPGTGDAVFDSAEASRVVTDLMRSLGFDPPESPVRLADPRNGAERPEDALRRYAGQLERLKVWLRAHPEVPEAAGTDQEDSAVTTILDLLDRMDALAKHALPKLVREMGLGQLDAAQLADVHGGTFGLAPAGAFESEAGERTRGRGGADAVQAGTRHGEWRLPGYSPVGVPAVAGPRLPGMGSIYVMPGLDGRTQ